MKDIDQIIQTIFKEVEKTRLSLPDRGRRMEIQAYILPKEWISLLSTDEVFKMVLDRGMPNLGGIPIYEGKEFKIIYIQKEKQRKVWKGKL